MVRAWLLLVVDSVSIQSEGPSEVRELEFDNLAFFRHAKPVGLDSAAGLRADPQRRVGMVQVDEPHLGSLHIGQIPKPLHAVRDERVGEAAHVAAGYLAVGKKRRVEVGHVHARDLVFDAGAGLFPLLPTVDVGDEED